MKTISKINKTVRTIFSRLKRPNKKTLTLLVLQNKRFFILIGILVLFVSVFLLRKPAQIDNDTAESNQKTTNVQLTNWKKYNSPTNLPQGYSYPAYSMNIPDSLYLRADNSINIGKYNPQDKRFTTSWSSNSDIDADKLKDGFFVTIDVEMNPKTSKGDSFTIDNYESDVVMDCEGTPQVWNFAGLRAEKYVCDDLFTSAGKPAVIVNYSVMNDGKLFTVRAASLDENIITLNHLGQIIDSFRFVKEADRTPRLEGNTIKINITNPHYSPNKEGYFLFYEYTFSYDRRPDDIIDPIKQGYGQGLEIKRAATTLSIAVVFDGGQVLYDRIPNPVTIHNPLSDSLIYRITSVDQAYIDKSFYDNRDFAYVSQYQENKPAMVGSNSCGQSVDPIAACSGPGVSISKNNINLYCRADSNTVFNCDDIVKSLEIKKHFAL